MDFGAARSVALGPTLLAVYLGQIIHTLSFQVCKTCRLPAARAGGRVKWWNVGRGPALCPALAATVTAQGPQPSPVATPVHAVPAFRATMTMV